MSTYVANAKKYAANAVDATAKTQDWKRWSHQLYNILYVSCVTSVRPTSVALRTEISVHTCKHYDFRKKQQILLPDTGEGTPL